MVRRLPRSVSARLTIACAVACGLSLAACARSAPDSSAGTTTADAISENQDIGGASAAPPDQTGPVTPSPEVTAAAASSPASGDAATSQTGDSGGSRSFPAGR